ncbi:Uncharacterized protein LOCC1_G003372 [Lachnellula occidentalis]|uniref:Utp8 beta-propeller domain-containing protein n=1 Tax=Lachnellula occidentalis TaxID=215460 RepID=A0A8H8S843_9HELO|nr:Uncharacterized protein LOCC1_G003372 [Lachnellula occidentalis]
MSSKFSLQSPYVVASLPRPIDHSKGRYVVGDVYGGAPGAKKRKRSELAVGIDGEGLNLYDISSSKLITSYALPPQSSFTCPPASLRTRISKSKTERRTYASTAGIQSQISLFHDVTEGTSHTKSSTISHSLQNTRSSVVFLGVISATFGLELSATSTDLLVIRKDGEIQCLDGGTLQEKWNSPTTALVEGHDATRSKDFEIEFAHLTNAHAASQSILKNRQDVLAVFAQEISEDGFNPDLVVLVTKASETLTRTLHIIAPPRRTAHISGLQHSVQALLTAPFPLPYKRKDNPTFSIQVSSGILQQLSNNTLTTFDLTESGPKEQSSLSVSKAESFLRLSSTSIMISSNQYITVYNPKYQSILAAIDFTSEESLKRKRQSQNETNGTSNSSCNLITYFPKLGAVVGIKDNNLIAIHVEGHQDRQGRPRAAGLLIDSLGCSVKEQSRPGRGKRGVDSVGANTLEEYLPGPITTFEGPWAEQTESFEKSFIAEDAEKFDELIAEKLPTSSMTEPNSAKPFVNGVKVWAKEALNVDRRWVIYALSKIFSRIEESPEQSKLSISFYPPKVFLWLINAGHMTVANIEAALRIESATPPAKTIASGELISAIVELNPDMDLLLALTGKNYLGATELLHAIRTLMESLEMLGENTRVKQGLLTNGEDAGPVNGDADEQLEELEAEAEKDLELAEYQLGPGSGIRGQALSLALSKLYTCPTSAIVHALQTTLTSQEIVCLIYLLRFELARGAWTAKYFDDDESELVDEDAEVPGSAIILISSLLNNCIDAVGAGGWLSGDLKLVEGDPFEAEELISSLKLEVSAALEGIQEAAYLKGLTSEMVRYGDAMQKSLPQEREPDSDAPGRKKHKGPVNPPILLPSSNSEAKVLPLGLRADKQISLLKIGAGGEVSRRTARDIGHLKSQKVGKYTLERIMI